MRPTPTNTPTPITATLNAATDSYVQQDTATTNYGAAANLDVRSRSVQNRRAFAQFSLSSIPAASTITSATLKLYMYTAPSASRTIEARTVSANWTESGITWSNQPAAAAAATTSTATGTTANVWLQWDVTSDVAAFLNGTKTNYGWRLGDLTEDSSTARLSQFNSKENANTSILRPQLVVTYNP